MNKQVDTPEFMSVAETAEFFKVDTETVYRWLKKGVIKAHKVGKKWFIPAKTLRDLLK